MFGKEFSPAPSLPNAVVLPLYLLLPIDKSVE